MITIYSKVTYLICKTFQVYNTYFQYLIVTPSTCDPLTDHLLTTDSAASSIVKCDIPLLNLKHTAKSRVHYYFVYICYCLYNFTSKLARFCLSQNQKRPNSVSFQEEIEMYPL